MCEKLTSSDELHHEEQLIVRLEHVIHSDQKRMISLKQNRSLQERGLQHLALQNCIFAQRLHGIVLAIALLLDEEDFAKSSLSNYFLNYEVAEIGLLLRLSLWYMLELLYDCDWRFASLISA